MKTTTQTPPASQIGCTISNQTSAILKARHKADQAVAEKASELLAQRTHQPIKRTFGTLDALETEIRPVNDKTRALLQEAARALAAAYATAMPYDLFDAKTLRSIIRVGDWCAATAALLPKGGA